MNWVILFWLVVVCIWLVVACIWCSHTPHLVTRKTTIYSRWYTGHASSVRMEKIPSHIEQWLTLKKDRHNITSARTMTVVINHVTARQFVCIHMRGLVFIRRQAWVVLWGQWHCRRHNGKKPCDFVYISRWTNIHAVTQFDIAEGTGWFLVWWTV